MEIVLKMTHELEFPIELEEVHLIFYISLLKKCLGDPTSIEPFACVSIKNNITY